MNWAESGLGQELPGLEGIWGLGRESWNSLEFALPAGDQELGVWEPGFSIYYLRNRLLEGKSGFGQELPKPRKRAESGLGQELPGLEGIWGLGRESRNSLEFALPAGDQELGVWEPWNRSGLAPQPPIGGWLVTKQYIIPDF